MSEIVTGLHYGKTAIINNGKRQLWLELRPFNWNVDKKILKNQHAKHYFKDAWIKPGNIVTVTDKPRWNAVYVTAVRKGTDADKIINDLHSKECAVKPILRPKYPKSNHYRAIRYRLYHMLKFAKGYAKKRKPGQDNVAYISPKSIHRYAFYDGHKKDADSDSKNR